MNIKSIRISTVLLIIFFITSADKLLATEYKNLEDAVVAAESLIDKQYNKKIANKLATENLQTIVFNKKLSSNEKIEEIVKFIRQRKKVEAPPENDCDGDGTSDKKDPHPLVVSYNKLKWDINSISLGWKIDTKITGSQTTTNSNSTQKSKKFAYTWNKRIKHNRSGKIYLTPNPLKLFGLLSSSLSAKFALTGQVDWNRHNQEVAKECYKTFLETSKQTTIQDLNLTFTVTFYNLSNKPLFFTPRTIPILLNKEHVADAVLILKEKEVVIPENRENGIEKMFIVKLDNTKALKIVDFMKQQSPTIRLEKSGIRVLSQGSNKDIISDIITINKRTVPVIVKTSGGETTWRIAKEKGNQLTTIGKAFDAINKTIPNNKKGERFFLIDKDSGLVNAAGFNGKGEWFILGDGKELTNDGKMLNRKLYPFSRLEIILLTQRDIQGDFKNLSTLFQKVAVKWYKKAAEQGSVEDQNLLGLCYQNGQGVTKNYKEAVKWFKKAAEQGYAIAQYNLGSCYQNGQGITKDYKEAVKWYKKAAEQGRAIAQYKLGFYYKFGKGVVKDYTEAAKWYRKAAEQGYRDAQHDLGNCYYHGNGVAKNHTEAAKWYRKAAEQGVAKAQHMLGNCYYYGYGVTINYKEAVKWYRKAAEQGDKNAQYELGYCIGKGIGVNLDHTKAARWFNKAANQGHKKAAIFVYSLCHSGLVKKEDIVENR